MKKLGLIFTFAVGLMMAIMNDGMADEIVVEELGLGAAKKTKDRNVGCGSSSSKRWFGLAPVYYFTLRTEVASLSCEIKLEASPRRTAEFSFSSKVELSDWGKEKTFDSPHLSFAFIDYKLEYKNSVRKCFSYLSVWQESKYRIVSGVYCGRSQTEIEFKNFISKIRWDFQTKKSSQPVSATSPETSPTTSTSPKANDANNSSVEERLAAIKRLLDKGLISEDEAKAKRQEILSKI